MPPSETFIPLVDLEAQQLSLRDRIDARVNKVLSEGRFILGPEVSELEQQLTQFCGAGHAISVANGTDALKIPLMAQCIGPGDAVFVPPFTFVATAEVVVDVGATPIFVDIDPGTFNMAPDALTRSIEAVRARGELRPRAIIPVDLFGLPADYAAINDIAAEHELLIIADAAQSMGGSIDGRRVGSLARVSATSFYPSKPLGCYGDGGCIFTDDEDIAGRLRIIRGHGLDPSNGDALMVGVNSRLDTLQAAILLSKLEVFDAEIEMRQQVARWYSERLKDVARPPAEPAGINSAWAVYSILIDQRDTVRAALTANNIGSAIYYLRPLHLHPAYERFGSGAGSMPVCEGFSSEIISLPMSPYLAEDIVARICDTVIAAVT